MGITDFPQPKTDRSSGESSSNLSLNRSLNSLVIARDRTWRGHGSDIRARVCTRVCVVEMLRADVSECEHLIILMRLFTVEISDVGARSNC